MRRLHLLFAVTSLALAACGHKTDASPEKAAVSGTPAGSGAAAPAGTTAAAANMLTITGVAPAVGDKREDKESSNMDMTLSITMGAKSKELKMNMVESTTRQEEVLAVADKAVTKAKVTYVDKTKSQTEDGKEKKAKKNPLVGKTYILELKDGKLAITDEKGKKVPKAEEDQIRKDNSHFGKPDPFTSAIPTKPMEVGKPVPELSTAIQEQMAAHDSSNEKDKLNVGDVEVKLASIEGSGADQQGVFDVKLTLSSPKSGKNPFEMKIMMAGQLKVRAKDGWPTSFKASGPLEMGEAGGKKGISGSGTLQLTFETTYTK
ncbi:MAG: hypothetical protein U0441_13590 [Polyangiaceae bacterium]